MTLSVIIPTYNGAAYLRETLESVFAQTLPADEVIAVDDGSTDGSPDILCSFGDRITIVRQKNQGVAVARNTGLEHASGDLIAFLDQDDLWPADRNRRLVEALRDNNTAEVAAGLVAIRYERSTPPDPLWNLATMLREYLLGSLCIRADLFRKLGRLNTNVGYADDTDFWFRRDEANTPTIYLDDVTLVYRLHDKNTSWDRSRSNGLLLTVLRERLKRRRHRNENKLYHSGL